MIIDDKLKLQNLVTKKFTGFLALLIIAGFTLAQTEYALAEKTVCDFQNRECFTEAGYPACYNKVDIQKYYEFTEKGQTGLAEGIISDDARCVKLNGNEKAAMMDKSQGFVKFVLRGSNKTLWAKREALYAN
ncbi:MAG: hypothetical protein AB1598_08455 [Thermodesulfobacteriota bacterium]